MNLKNATLVALIGSGLGACWGLYGTILNIISGNFLEWGWRQLPYLISDITLFVFFIALFQVQQKRK